jgi:PKD repeat protein
MRKMSGIVAALALLGASHGALGASLAWSDVKAEAIPLAGPRLIHPRKVRTFTFDVAALRATLQRAPLESAAGTRPTLTLPMPDGTTITMAIAESPVMQPGLAAKYPQIRTYAGRSTTDAGVTGRFGLGPRGFHGMIFTPRGTVYIDPFSRGETRAHQVYFRHDLPARSRAPDTVLPRSDASSSPADALPGIGAAKGASIAGELRTYRLALAADGEYSMFHDPQTLPSLPRKDIVLAELVNVVNRVTGVYERELGIRLVLINNNDLLIFQNSEADPYKDDDPTSMVASNTAIIDAIVGPTAYDIGHVATTGGGGVAFLGVVCFEAQKGGGVTGLPQPIGDAYYIDYVAHEMGHQFGGNHTFNGTTGSCAGSNRNAGTAYEPGSGITIMAYAGICPEQNVALHSIDTFHAASFDEIVAYTRTSDGNACAVKTSTGNQPPVVTMPAGGHTIPQQTPFELTASATDPDGDALTYQWEQMDLGPAGAPNDAATSTGTPPLFRPFAPSSTPDRTFPQLSDLVADRQTLGEILPATTRAMKFRLTVRDNHAAPSAGGVASDDYTVNVTAAAGPFRVMFPHAQTVYQANEQMNVQWLVAGTTAAPVSCGAVDILASTDGGRTFPALLANDTPNDGSESVTLPATVTDATVLKVKCSDNVFFALSTENFLTGLQPPVASVGADYENPDTDGAYTLSWVRPATGVGPDTLQASASCGPVFTDDAAEQLVLGANAKWSGSPQWVSQDSAYFIVDGSSQAEALSLINPITIPAGAVSTLTFRTSQDLEPGYDFGRVRVDVDGAGFKTIVAWTGAYEGTRTVDLSQFAGHSIRLEFLMLSDEFSEDAYLGWSVDDIAITATVFQEVATVPGTSYTVRGQPVGNYCYRARTTHFIDGQTGPSPYGNVVNVAVASTNRLPVAALSASPQTGAAPLDAVFDASASTDADGDALTSYTFDFGDGSAPQTRASPTATHRYVDAGSYVATVTVTDARGAQSAPAQVAVDVTEPQSNDLTPDAFTFAERAGVQTGVFVTSEGKTITGIDAPAPVSIANGQYSIGGGAYTTAAGTIANGQVLRVRHVSASGSGETVESTITVGTYATTFRSTTTTVDRTPDAFAFATQTGVELNTVIESNVITPAGYNTAVAVVAGPGASYRIDGGAWTTASGTINPGQTLQTRHTSSSGTLAYTKTYLKVGGVTGYFTTRTK